MISRISDITLNLVVDLDLYAMKFFVPVFLLLFPVIAFPQASDFVLKSRVGNLNVPAKAYLMYRKGPVVAVDSAAVKNGMFEFKGIINNPVRATLVLDHKGIGLNRLRNEGADVLGLYLEKGNITLISADSVSKAKISGSKINEDNTRFLTEVMRINNKLPALEKEFNAATKEQQQSLAFREDFQKRAEAIEKEQRTVSKEFILKNPASFVSLDILTSYGGYYPEYSEVQPLFAALAPAIRSSEAGNAYSETLERVKLTALGAIAPEFTQNDPNGNPVKISDFRGKYVLLDFWAAWCGPCRQENPNVVENYNKYKDKNFTVLGVSLDRPGDKEKWLKAIRDDKLAWTHVSELNYFNNSAAVKYGIVAIPQNYLIDPEGRIVAKNLRGDELGRKLQELLSL